jgi:signal transduction histidine kinase
MTPPFPPASSVGVGRRGWAVRLLVGAVVLTCLLQIAWWIYFQQREGRGDLEQARQIAELLPYKAAADLEQDNPMARQAAEEWLQQEYPELTLATSGPGVAVPLAEGPTVWLQVRPGHLESARQRARSKVVMIASEGGFLALAVVIGVIAIYFLQHREVQRQQEQVALLGAFTHEFRSPLTALRALVQSVQLGRVRPEEEATVHQTMLSSVLRLEDLVQNVLTAARFHGGTLQTQPQPTDLKDEIDRFLDARKTLWQRHEVELGRELENGVVVQIDRGLLHSVLSNLLENAVKYSGRPVSVTIELSKTRSQAELRVRDRGQGFDPAMGGRLFQRFFRGASETDRSRPGLGLGLYLVREIVLLFGGQVQAFSEGRGRGAEFLVRLPLAEAAS